MTTDDLKKILSKWNRATFEGLEDHPHKPELVLDEVERGLRIYRLPPSRKCHCGESLRLAAFPEQLCRDGQSVAVGAILDAATDTTNIDLPVVVAVGINYGQFGSSMPTANVVPQNWNNTDMRSRLQKVLEQLASGCCGTQMGTLIDFTNTDAPQSSFHLVAVNFFPWLTENEWGEIGMNSITESLVLRCWGYSQPAQRIAELIRRISGDKLGSPEFVGEVPFVVFHGANNAVPLLGTQTSDHVRDATVWTNSIYCDNLSRPGRPKNAVVACPCVPVCIKRRDSKMTMDE